MGYSFSAAAGLVQEAMLKELNSPDLGNENHKLPSNSWQHKGQEYFMEQGRENPDGAITGTIYQIIPSGIWKGRCKRAGRVRIEKNGIITAWSCVPREYIKRAEAIGAAMFINRYGQNQALFERILQPI